MAPMNEKIDFRNPQYYINRELSWLQFNRRCLSESRSKDKGCKSVVVAFLYVSAFLNEKGRCLFVS